MTAERLASCVTLLGVVAMLFAERANPRRLACHLLTCHSYSHHIDSHRALHNAGGYNRAAANGTSAVQRRCTLQKGLCCRYLDPCEHGPCRLGLSSPLERQHRLRGRTTLKLDGDWIPSLLHSPLHSASCKLVVQEVRQASRVLHPLPFC